VHGDATDLVLADVLLDLDDDVDGLGHVETLARDADRGIDLRQAVLLEGHVHDGADDLDDDSFGFRLLCHNGLLSALLEGFDGGHDLEKLLGDGGLADLVEDERQVDDELLGALSGVFHGHHAGRLFRGLGLG
jgi:hypothetical protein